MAHLAIAPDFYRPFVGNVQALDMPEPEEVVFTHGPAADIWGIRLLSPDSDIDFITTYKNVQYLREQLGWLAVPMVVGIDAVGKERTIYSTRDPEGKYDVHRWDFSRRRHMRTGYGRIYLPEHKARGAQDPDTGMWVTGLRCLREVKAETGRPQDELLVARIDRILCEHLECTCVL